MLEITYHSKHGNLMEAKVRNLIGQIIILWDFIEDFKRVYNTNIRKMEKMNAFSAEFAYRIKTVSKTKVEIWHYTPEGNADRQICTIIETKNEYENSGL